MFSEDSNAVPNESGRSIMAAVDNSIGQSAASSATVPVVSSVEVLHPPSSGTLKLQAVVLVLKLRVATLEL